jgi:hypothetical protein
MAYPQPYFHDLTVRATWDGEISQAVHLEITLGIGAIPNSRLRLISLEAVNDAEMTGVNENSPTTTYTGDAGAFVAQEFQERESNRDHNTSNVITDLSVDTPSHSIHASRIPLPLSGSRSLWPQKRLFSVAQRPKRPLPAFKDAKTARGKSSKADESKSMTSHSASGNCSPTKPASEHLQSLDPTRGRELVRSEVARRASYHALSGNRTVEGTREQKVTEWLHQNEHVPITAPSIIHEYDPKHPCNGQHLGPSSVVDGADENEQLPPSPSPSSQAIAPWTSVRYRNPLRLRGAGSCVASFEKFNGCLYAVFPQHVMQTIHRVQLQAKVNLRKDPEKGGYLLELPGLPKQDNTEGCFTLLIVGDGEREYPAHRRIALVDKNFGTVVLTFPQMDFTFNTDTPLSIKIHCFEDDVQVLKEADFDIVYDVRTTFGRRTLGSANKDTISYKHLMVCSIRLRDFLILAHHLQVTIFISDGQVSALQTESVSHSRQINLGDRRKDGREREVTVVMEAADVTRPFEFVFEGTLETHPWQHWVPRVSRSRQLAQDIRAHRDKNGAVQEFGFTKLHEPELKVSDVIFECQSLDSTTIRAKSNGQVVPNPHSQRAFECYHNIWYALKLLFVAYLLACYVTTQFGFNRQLVEGAKGWLIDSWTDLAAIMSERPPAHQTEVEIEKHRQIEHERHQQVGGDGDEREDKMEDHHLPMQEMSLRDRIDRALGWKGPKGDW